MSRSFCRAFSCVRSMSESCLPVVQQRHLTIRSSTGTAFELKNAQSSIQELSVEIHRVDDGRAYEVVATLDDVTMRRLSGIITFDTSLASIPESRCRSRSAFFGSRQAARLTGLRVPTRYRAPLSATLQADSSMRRCSGQALLLVVASMGLGLLRNSIPPRGRAASHAARELLGSGELYFVGRSGGALE